MEENREVLELLRKIDRSSRMQTWSGYVRTALVLVCAVCMVVLTCAVLKLMPQIGELLEEGKLAVAQAQLVLSNLERTTNELANLDLAGMVTNVDGLVKSAQESLADSMAKLNAIDFETLNKAIKDLAAVIEPLANVTRVLGR